MRAFLAVIVSADLRERIAGVQQELKTVVASISGGGARVTWVKPETIHLTVKFLGEIETDEVESLRSRVTAAIDGRCALRIPLGALGAFPRIEAPRALWIGPLPHWDSQPEAKLAQELAARIEEACGKSATPQDTHPWRPHLTIARVREGQREVAQVIKAGGLVNRALDIGPLPIARISLMKSEMRPDGPVHTSLWSASLGG